MMSTRQFLSLIAMALLSSHTVYCMEKVRLQLKWLHQFQFAGYYAAIEQGYYAKAGLDVEIIEATADKSPAQSVIDGTAEFGISNSDILRLRSHGHPLVAIAVIYQHSPLALISSKEAGIQSIHDLVGKKVMIQEGSADLLALLKSENIPLDSLEIVPHSFDYKSLTNGSVSAFSGYTTNEPYSLISDGVTPIVFSPRSVDINFYGDALFTTEPYLKAHPEVVEAFRTASLQGWEYALAHPEEIIDLILKKYSKRKSKAELTYEAQQSVAFIRQDLVALGYMNPHRWEHIAHVLRQEGMIQGPVDLDQMLYRPEKPFPLIPFLQVLGIAALCLGLLGVFTRHQINLKRKLEAEIERRKQGEKMLLKREEEYRELYENAPLAFIVFDTDLRIRAWNQAATTLFGWQAAEVIGKKATDFFVPQSSIKEINTAQSGLYKNKQLISVNENYTKDGRIIWCKWHNVSHKDIDGNTTEFHSIAVDVTDEIAEHSQLEAAYSKALNASEAKDILLAHTSHEIRNPLNAIMGFTQIILSENQDPETQEMAKVILDGAEGMLEILNDLLDSAKIEAGKMTVQWSKVDLATSIQKEAKLFSQLITNNGLKHSVSIAQDIPGITSDPRFIHQILHNLINNAIKFTNSGTIEITLEPEGPDHIAIHVSDTGVGMDEKTLQQVFEPFAQANNAKHQNVGGTGLGLSLTKKIAELLGGTLTATSTVNIGSCFSLHLPIEPKREPLPDTDTSAQNNATETE